MKQKTQNSGQSEYGKGSAISDAVIIAVVLVAVVAIIAGIVWLSSRGLETLSVHESAPPPQPDSSKRGHSILGIVIGAGILLVSTFILSWNFWQSSRGDIMNRSLGATDSALMKSWLFSVILGLAGCVVVGAATHILWGILSIGFLFVGPLLFLPVHRTILGGMRKHTTRKFNREFK